MKLLAINVHNNINKKTDIHTRMNKCIIIIVNSRFLQRPQKRSRGNQLIQRRKEEQWTKAEEKEDEDGEDHLRISVDSIISSLFSSFPSSAHAVAAAGKMRSTKLPIRSLTPPVPWQAAEADRDAQMETDG